jgi:hypothetical protein
LGVANPITFNKCRVLRPNDLAFLHTSL